MTERELKKLGRSDLLKMLLEQRKENEQLRMQVEEAQAQLASRSIAIQEAGSIAEAALQLNGVFDAAQNACAQYIMNIKALNQEQEQICAHMEQRTREMCKRMVAEAKQQAQAYWDEVLQHPLPKHNTQPSENTSNPEMVNMGIGQFN